jgi:hypothetical protein
MRLRSLAVAVALCWALDTPGAAQSDRSYLALLDSYAAGQVTEAVDALSAWPQARVRAAVRSLDARAAVERARTALMLHTETAFREPADRREPFHVEVARSFLGRVLAETADVGGKRVRPSPEARDLGARWHALLGILYCVRDDDRRALMATDRGLALDSKHKDVNLVAGARVERGRAFPQANAARSRSISSTQSYRSILSNHPDFLEARLRLGWVLHAGNSTDSQERSREQLEYVVAQAARRDLLYLAHLFLGSVHERANRLSEAAREYEAARGVMPMQSAVIGLIRVETALGHDDRARALTADIPAANGPGTFDLWHSYNSMCFTSGALLEGLRAEAQRP